MVVVPAGSFERNHRYGPVHCVVIGEPFAVGVKEVTRGEYGRFVRATGHSTGDSCSTYEPSRIYPNDPWEEREGRDWENPGFEQTDGHPAVCVNWEDAKAYVRWLSDETGEEYRLLSESEWEYAALEGMPATGNWLTDGGQCQYAQCRYEIGVDRTAKNRTESVGSYESNVYGLHDLMGNVWEWVEDCFNEGYAGAPSDGSAWETGDCSQRVVRGGSWEKAPGDLREADRAWITTGDRGSDVGFRVARTLTFEDLKLRRLSELPGRPLSPAAGGVCASCAGSSFSELLGRPLSPAAVDEDGFTDLHYAALLNLPDAVRELMAAGAVIEPWVAVVDRMIGVSYVSYGTELPGEATEAEFLRDPLAHGFRDTFYFEELTEAEWKDFARSRELSEMWPYELHDLSDPVRRRLCRLVGDEVVHRLRLDYTPLEFAVVGNAVEALSVLTRGGSLLEGSKAGKLLALAIQVDAREAAAWLLDHDADVNVREVESERTPLHYAARNGDARLVELLAARGMDVDARDGRGRTPLHYAAWEDRPEIVKVLAAAGADPMATRDDGSTPLHDAAWRNARASVEALLEAGVPVGIAAVPSIEWEDSGEDGPASGKAAGPGAWTPLHRAAWNDARDAAEALLAHGAEVNARDFEGWTPLHAAAAGNAPAAARLLLERGADMEARDRAGWTALHHAVWHEARPVATLLASRGARLDGKPGSDDSPLYDAGWWARAVRTVGGLEYYQDWSEDEGELVTVEGITFYQYKSVDESSRIVPSIWLRIHLNQYLDSIAGVCSLDRPPGERAARVETLLENLRKFVEAHSYRKVRPFNDPSQMTLSMIRETVLKGAAAAELNRSYLDAGSGSDRYEALGAAFGHVYSVFVNLGPGDPREEWAVKIAEGLACLGAAPAPSGSGCAAASQGLGRDDAGGDT